MKLKSVIVVLSIGILIFSSIGLLIVTDLMSLNARGDEPVLSDPDVYYDDSMTYLIFEVRYQHPDNNEGRVWLFIDYEDEGNWVEIEMETYGISSPIDGQLFEVDVLESNVYDYSSFYFYAEDTGGNSTFLPPGLEVFYVGDFIGWNTEPILSNPEVWTEHPNVFFGVLYQDINGDLGTVFLFLDEEPYEMEAYDYNPVEGQYFGRYISESEIDDYMEFYYYAEDNNGSFTFLPEGLYVYLVGDFLGWGEEPILSNPDVYYDDGNYIFNVTYQDEEGHEGEIELILYNGTDYKYEYMTPSGGDPWEGQNFIASVSDSFADNYTEFYFSAEDSNGSHAYLWDTNGEAFMVGPFLVSDNDENGDENGEDGNGGGLGFALPGFLKDAEVVVGIIGLVALAGGSAYGVWRRKKKHGRFSELLTELDDIYGSYKLNPSRCETELEKLRATINEDLKKNTIDENNYSILKGRIDEIITEIRKETLRTQVSDLPKDIELKIKDMLIDGEITRAEYDRLLPIIKGSDMASDDKEKMKKMVESWVKEDKNKT